MAHDSSGGFDLALFDAALFDGASADESRFLSLSRSSAVRPSR